MLGRGAPIRIANRAPSLKETFWLLARPFKRPGVSKQKPIFRRVPMKPMSHRRNAVLWLGVVAALWPMALPTKAPAHPAEEVPSGSTKLLRYGDISKDRVVFAYAGDLWIAAREGGAA